MSATKFNPVRVREYLTSLVPSYSKARAERAAKNLFGEFGLREPVINWLPSPLACSKKISHHNRFNRFLNFFKRPSYFVMQEELRREVSGHLRTSGESRPMEIRDWAEYPEASSHPFLECAQTATRCRNLLTALAAREFKLNKYTESDSRKLDCWKEIFLSTHMCFPFFNDDHLVKSTVYISEPPITVKRDANGRLHREDGASIAYGNRDGLYYWHGVHVPKFLISEPNKITTSYIVDQENAEVRRVAMERFGLEKFLRRMEATLEDNAEQVGNDGKKHPLKLWEIVLRRGRWNEERLHFLEMKNSTPEPDGSYKTYVLQTPPDIDDAWDSLAWTFGINNYVKYDGFTFKRAGQIYREAMVQQT